jgi:hypothetical protein
VLSNINIVAATIAVLFQVLSIKGINVAYFALLQTRFLAK